MNSDTSTSFGGGRSRKCWLGRRRQELIPRHPCKLHPFLILAKQGELLLVRQDLLGQAPV
jgi:hypothetical protein